MLSYTNTDYLVTLTDVTTTYTILRLVFYITEIIQPKKFRKEASISSRLQTMG